MYSMKSGYDLALNSMGRQLALLSSQQSKISHFNNDSAYAKIVKETQSPAEIAIAGTGGSNNKCKHCNGQG